MKPGDSVDNPLGINHASFTDCIFVVVGNAFGGQKIHPATSKLPGAQTLSGVFAPGKKFLIIFPRPSRI